MKRAMDIFASAAGLILLSPLLLVTAVLICWRMGSPILFAHQRPGLHGRPFRMLKFRSMLDPNDAEGRPLSPAERVTPFGRLLRSTSIDELPGLWNVLKGDMSLVGPRPLLMDYLPLYSSEQARRHDVRPGLTGWAQVNGRNRLNWEDKFSLDVWYVDNRSLWLDVKILLLTINRVFKRDGINQSDSVTAERFRGSAKENLS